MNGNANHYTLREILLRLGRALHALAKSPVRRQAMVLGGLLVAFLFAINGLNVLNSYVGRDFISAIEHRDRAGFQTQTWLYAGVFLLSSLVAVIYRFCEERLALLWRDWQTRDALEHYLDKRVYYHLEGAGTVQNPDQRIAEDIRTFTTTTLSFFLMLLNGAFTVVAFSGVLWSISPRLFLVAVVYATAGTLITVLLGRKLVGYNHQLLDREANFRAELIHLRQNAESIAVFNREGRMKKRLLQRLEELVSGVRSIIGVNRNVGFFTTAYNYMIQLLPALIVAPLFIRGEVEFGVITQSAMAFAALMGAFSLIVTQFQSISSYAAVIGRLSTLRDGMVNLRCLHSPVELLPAEQEIRFDALTLHRPGDGVVLKDLNLTISRGKRVLVLADSGHARTALFRATAGLVCDGAGKIHRPGPDNLTFLPEQPYLPRGTLRDVLVRSVNDSRISDEEVIRALREVKMESVAEQHGLHESGDWQHLLTLHEQAALLVARALLAAPDFVFMDRMSVALDAEDAREIIRRFADRGIGCIVLGEPDDDLGPFDAALTIRRDGTWSWRTVVE